MSADPVNWSEIDCYRSWELWVASERVELQAGRKLSPQEMIERVDEEARG